MASKRRKKNWTRAERERLRELAQQKTNERRNKARARAQGSEGFAFTSRVYTLEYQLENWFFCRKKRAPELKGLRLLIPPVLKHRPDLLTSEHKDGLTHLARMHWLRAPESWHPRGRNPDQVFASLAQHLLASYPVCPHLWAILYEDPPTHKTGAAQMKAVLRTVAHGHSLRRLVGTEALPVPLTRKMVHDLLNPPRAMGFVAMIRRAQVLNGGGTEALAHLLKESDTLHRILPDEKFWSTVIQWLCRQQLPSHKPLQQILDYLEFRLEEKAPLIPGARSWRSLLEEARFWEKAREREWQKRPRRKRPAKPGATGQASTGMALAPHRQDDWTIKRINTVRKLLLEGTLQRHCVGSYGEELRSGERSYWSLSQAGKRLITIEVNHAKKEIQQASGRANRVLRHREWEHLNSWAQANGLSICGWIE